MSRKAIFIVLIAAILITALVWTKLFAAEKSPLLPADVRADVHEVGAGSSQGTGPNSLLTRCRSGFDVNVVGLEVAL